MLTITGGTNAVLGSGTTVQVAQATATTSGYLSSADWVTFNDRHYNIGVNLSGGNAMISTGIKGYRKVQFGGTITAWELYSSSTGSITIDVLDTNYSNFPTATSVTAGNPPSITAGVKNHNTSPSFTAISDGDLLVFNVTSCSGITNAWLMLTITPTSAV